MPKLKLLIFDAGVVIKLHEWRLWDHVTAKCDVYLSSIVAGRETKYHQVAGDDWDQDIDLSQAIRDGTITVFHVAPADILKFKNRFVPSYFAILDDGEAESLTYLTSQKTTDFKISSRDAIVPVPNSQSRTKKLMSSIQNPKSRIQSAWERLFHKHRVVFWYDEEKSLRSDFNAIDLAEVEKVEIANNEFGLKYRLLREQPMQKFLVFKSGPQRFILKL